MEGDALETQEQQAAKESGGRSAMRRWALMCVGAVALTMLTCGTYEFITWPDVGELKGHNPESTAFVAGYRDREARKGQPLHLEWRWVPYDSISPHLKRAVVAAEDLEFFSHHGFSYTEIREAVRDAIIGERELRGASTITQQLAKNLWLSPSRNPLRKVKEAILTYQLESELSKKRILELYLNVVEFGPGIFGAEAAARHYFAKPAAELSEDEAAQLGAALPRPSRWHPGSESDSYWDYVAEIRQRMDRATFLWRRI